MSARGLAAGRRCWLGLAALVVGTLALVGGPAAGQERFDSSTQFLKESGARYWEARQKGLAADAKVARQLLASQGAMILDLRAASAAEALPIPGSHRMSLRALLMAGGNIDRSSERPVIVVADDSEAALEAMVFLRLAGVPALALTQAAGSLVETRERTPGAPAVGDVNDPRPARSVGTPSSPLVPAPRDDRLFAVAGSSGLILVVVLGYFLVWSPQRKRRKLSNALAIIQQDQEAQFARAAQILSSALTSGLRARDVAEARFALAYVHARMGDWAKAEATLSELLAEGPQDRYALYLDLQVKVQLKKYDEAIARHEASADQLGGLADTARLASIAHLQVGRACLARRDMDRALGHFDKVRNLKVMQDRVPEGLQEHQVVLGVQALLEKDFEEAERRFKSAGETARRENKPTDQSDLGLLLCNWRRTDEPDVDDALGGIVDRLRQRATHADSPECDAKERELDEAQLLLRNVALWHAVSLLFGWRRRPARSGLPEDERLRLHSRLALVREVDPRQGDALLIAGLIDYYFSEDDAGRRAAAVETLDAALAKQINLPEAHLIVERERKLAEAARKSVETFLGLVRQYLGDASVPLSLRAALKARLERFSRFRTGDRPIEITAEQSAPSVHDLHSRSILARRRIETIVRARAGQIEPAQADQIEALIKQLGMAAEEINQRADAMEKAEQSLMCVAGEALLAEEPAGVQSGTAEEGR